MNRQFHNKQQSLTVTDEQAGHMFNKKLVESHIN